MVTRLAARARPLALSLAVGACGGLVPGSPPRAPAPGPSPVSAPATSPRWADSVLASLTTRQKVAQLVWPWVLGDFQAQ